MERYINVNDITLKGVAVFDENLDLLIPLSDVRKALQLAPTADVVPKSEVEKIFEKLKVRECSNSVCAWCVHATAYGRRNEECDNPYIDKNGKEQKACYAYDKFESLIDNELAELKKKYTEAEAEPPEGD